jgi:hypothetical protein
MCATEEEIKPRKAKAKKKADQAAGCVPPKML